MIAKVEELRSEEKALVDRIKAMERVLKVHDSGKVRIRDYDLPPSLEKYRSVSGRSATFQQLRMKQDLAKARKQLAGVRQKIKNAQAPKKKEQPQPQTQTTAAPIPEKKSKLPLLLGVGAAAAAAIVLTR